MFMRQLGLRARVCVEISLSARKLPTPRLEYTSPDLSVGYISTHVCKHTFPFCILTDMLAHPYVS